MATPRELYEALDLAHLQRWVADQQQEDLRLDFKRLAGKSTLGKEDRAHLTEAVSGFANSDGGLIIWGVDCRKNSEGVDAACDLIPIENVAAVLSQLREHPGQITSPVVDGVEHRLIEGSDAGTGYLVTFIPPSDRGPHMAMDRRYYKRNGASFLKMEHFDVADMFGRRQRSDLEVKLRRYPQALDGLVQTYILIATIKNNGRARARDFKVIVSLPMAVNDWHPKALVNDGEIWGMEHSQHGKPLFPGEEIAASFSGARYHMTPELFILFRRGWPEVKIVIYQDDAPRLVETVSFEVFVSRGDD